MTVEDHSIAGGLGGAVAELLGEALPTPLKRLGVQGFGESGDPRASTPSTASTRPASRPASASFSGASDSRSLSEPSAGADARE